jgi:cytochrome b involved in lipid metabolism
MLKSNYMNKSNSFAVVFAIILITGGVFYYKKSAQNEPINDVQKTSQNETIQNQLPANNSADQASISEPVKNDTPAPVTPKKLYTTQTVAMHNTKSSCWTIVNGNVYDITKYITQHPGGESRIMSVCGTNGTSAFEGQHGGDSRPENTLAKFLLGPLQ